MEYTDEVFLKENKHTELLPAYIREYNKFYRLLKMFSNYIQNAVDIVEGIIENFNLSAATGDVLNKIAQRLDIYIEEPLNEDGTVNEELYEQQLKIAILGNGLKRTSLANRDSLNKILGIFSSIRSCEITDYSVTGSRIPMYIYISIVGANDTWTTEMLEKYVFPNITGVGVVVNYRLDNNIYFGFDTDNVLLGTIDLATASVTQTALNNRAAELGVTTVVDGMAIVDNESAYWMYNKGTWVDVGTVTVIGDTVIDPITGAAIRGWDNGQWIEENPID